MEARLSAAQSEAVLAALREKAAALPRSPGVYIMHAPSGKVIYVGKSRSLRDRVSQYFHGAHDRKTARMAGGVHDFEFIIKSVSAEDIVMEGVRHGHTYHMRPASTPPEEMIRNAYLMDRDITFRQAPYGWGRDLIGSVGGEEVELHLVGEPYAYVWWHDSTREGWRVMLYLKSKAAIVDHSPFAYTDKGVELMNDFTVGDVSFSRITLDFPGRKATLCDRFDNEVGTLTISDDIQCKFISQYHEPGYVPWDPDYYRNL